MNNTISAIVLIGENTDQNLLNACLTSIGWVDEIIKIDTKKEKGSFSDWRNLGAEKARGTWMFYVDTDEVVSNNLKEEILQVIRKNDFSGYAIPRKNIVFGREMKHCGLWPDYVLRIIKKEKFVKWEGLLHEQPIIKGEISYLKEPLIHQKHLSLSEMVDKTNKWSEIEARLMYDAHHPPMNIFRFMTAGFREFWLRMIVQTAFRDGSLGTIYGLYQVFSRLISYSKLWELQLKSSKDNTSIGNDMPYI
jgi:(heptosyl)LPS beta-1,4-glucosyltransferase